MLQEVYCKTFALRCVHIPAVICSVNLLYNYNFITSTYIRARCSFHNVWHRRYDPLTRNTCAISWSRREDDDNDETDDDDDDDDDCCISISWISRSPTEIWSRTLSNVRLHDNHLERVYNSPRIFMLPAAANCDSLTAVTKICHKELSFKDKWSCLITGVQGVFQRNHNVLLFEHCTVYNL